MTLEQSLRYKIRILAKFRAKMIGDSYLNIRIKISIKELVSTLLELNDWQKNQDVDEINKANLARIEDGTLPGWSGRRRQMYNFFLKNKDTFVLKPGDLYPYPY